MNRAESIAYLKKLKQRDEESADAVLPATKRDVEDEMGRMDTFREFERDKHSQKTGLTSDEK